MATSTRWSVSCKVAHVVEDGIAVAPRGRPTGSTVLVAATIPASVTDLLMPLIHTLADSGYRVEVVTNGEGRALPSGGPIVEVHQVPMTRELSPAADLRSLFAWIRLLRRVRPAVIVGFSPKASMLAMSAGALTRAPKRVYSTGGLRLESESGLRWLLLWSAEALTCRSATVVLANSRSLARRYQGLRLTKSVPAWTNSRKGVDPLRFDPSVVTPLAMPWGDDKPLIGYVGRVTRDKGIPTLIEALRLIASVEHPAFGVLVVGPAEGKGAEDLVNELRAVWPAIELLGSVDDVRPAYAAMDLLVLPSKREGFPNVVLEAAAMGVPAVVTDATGCIDSVTAETGWVFPSGDAHALAQALLRATNDGEALSLAGARAQRRARTDFAPADVVSDQLRKMGLKASAGGPGSPGPRSLT